jgi:DNA-binding MarR family transcriptional regulator
MSDVSQNPPQADLGTRAAAALAAAEQHGGPDPRVTLAGLLEVAKEALLSEFERELAKAGYGDIRTTHGCVFRFVRDDGMRLTELAALAGMTKQSVGELVDHLVQSGYVERIPDPEDKRAKLICLTARGKEAQRTGFDLFAELEERWGERYGAERVELLRGVLEEIAAGEAPEAVPELALSRSASR